MQFDGKLLARARDRLEIEKQKNQAEHTRREREIYRKIPRIEVIDNRLRAHMSELVGITLSRPADIDSVIALLEKENLDMQAEKSELLVENGFPIEYLDDIYSCSKCHDTGNLNGQVCSCLKELYNRELTSELGVLLNTGNELFESFDETLYDDVPDEDGESAREYMKRVRDTCYDYAKSFPKGDANLLFQGGTGLGKTYLSACIARVVAEKGYSVCYDTATSALDAFEIQKFSRGSEEGEQASLKVSRMLDCDLMILDDLGTEMITQMSLSSLYTLINTRLNNHKLTIISTNMTDEDLANKYTQQINSRLDGEYFKIAFIGRDIRRIKMEREV